MRILLFLLVFIFPSCASEEAWDDLTVNSTVHVQLPAESLWASIQSFTGLQGAAPQIFVYEEVFEKNDFLYRQLQLNDGTILQERIVEVDLSDKKLSFETYSTNLPINRIEHTIQIKKIDPFRSSISWRSYTDVQNINRKALKEKIEGIQQSYLLSLELLGLELEEILDDDSF